MKTAENVVNSESNKSKYLIAASSSTTILWNQEDTNLTVYNSVFFINSPFNYTLAKRSLIQCDKCVSSVSIILAS